MKKYSGNEKNYAMQFLGWDRRSNWVGSFEQDFSKKFNGQYCIAVNSGTSALHAALMACCVSGQEVILPALTPAMVAMAVAHAGARPVYVDVSFETYLLRADLVREKFTDKTAAILGVSLHGLPMNWDLFKEFDCVKIDDCAQALGAEGIGKADITCFSFEDKKHISCGSEGGMIMTGNENLATRARKFAGLGYKHMTAEQGRTGLAAETYQDPEYERFDTVGLNYRMSQIQAAVGIAQLERLDEIVDMRRTVAKMFYDAIDQSGQFDFKHSYYTWPYHMNHYLALSKLNDKWKEFYHRFKANGGDGFYASPKVPYHEPALKEDVFCPYAEDAQKKLMLFKTNYRDMDQAQRQADILRKTIRGN